MTFLTNTIQHFGVSRYQLRVLAVLTSVNFINFVDRQIIFALIPLIQLEFSISYAQAGLVGTVFSLVHSLSTCSLGVLADRTSLKKVIMAGMVFWSVATFLTGLMTTFRNLVIARGFVGLGEAAYAPAGTAIITGSFHRGQRTRVQGIFDAGMFMGGATGLAALACHLIGAGCFFCVILFVRRHALQNEARTPIGERVLEQVPMAVLPHE